MVEMLDADAAPVDVAVTLYDEIAYTSTVIPRIDPDRLATIARLHGIAAAPIATARILEVGGGDGLNLSAFAAAYPDSQCFNFDLASTAVARGKDLARAAGLNNIRIERLDILDAAETLQGEFDYILVHGVYAWVPAPVREAIFRLIGRVLAPNGVAIVSYNALPGQHLSLTLRAMIGAMLDDMPVGEERVQRAIGILTEYADGASDKDNAFVAGLRMRARDLAGRPVALLAHDEFGSCFEPQTFDAVCDAAAQAGLAYLNDSVYLPWEHGFSKADGDEPMLRRSMQIHDYESGCLFRHSMFVRDGQPIRRTFDPALAQDLLLSCNAFTEGNGTFAVSGGSFEVADQRLQVVLREAARWYPAQFPLAGLGDEHIVTLVRLFLSMAIHLSTGLSAAGGVSDRPRISDFTRAQIERGDEFTTGLDRQMSRLSDDFRRLLLLLDGTRDAAALAQDVGIGEAEAMAFIGLTAHRGLLMR